jgi:glycerophosphoryl diester phosphodiesterase
MNKKTIRQYTLPGTYMCLVCLITSLAHTEERIWNVRDHIPVEEITVQAHRGAGVLAPENSLEAFEIAWKRNVIPEADLRTTRDGVIVSFHDTDFTRILPDAPGEIKKLGVKDMTFGEVRKLDIGAWKGKEHEGQKIATLREITDVLKKHPERRIYADIKNVDFEKLAAETVDIHRQIILASTGYDEIRLWKKLAPDSYTLHWMGGTEQQLEERLEILEKNNFEFVDQLQIHVKVDSSGHFSPGDAFLMKTGEMLRKHGILFQAFPWECSDRAVYKRLMNLGVASFATDYPDVTMQAISEYYAR